MPAIFNYMQVKLPKKIKSTLTGVKRLEYVEKAYKNYSEEFKKRNIQINVYEHRFAELYKMLKDFDHK